MKKATFFMRIVVLILVAQTAQAQIKLGDNPGTINSNSILEIESTSKGILFPRLTDVQMTAMTAPPEGMVVYNMTTNCLNIRRVADWFSLCNADPTSTTNGFQLPSVTTVQMNAITNTTPGQIVYNTTANCVYVRRVADWYSLCNTASNGLTMSNNDIQLGGTLATNTTIDAGVNTLTLTGNTPLSIPNIQTGATNTIVTMNASGVLEKRDAGALLNTTAWKVDGNSATSDATNFLGTTDAQGLVVKTNNTERMRVLSTGEISVGRPAATTANATFHLGGSMALPISTQSANYTVSTSDYTVINDCTGGAFTLTLPDPTTCAGRTYILVKGDATNNVLTFSRPIFLSLAQSMTSVNYNVRLHIQSDGTNWWLIARF
jgi:hypothetical protein